MATETSVVPSAPTSVAPTRVSALALLLKLRALIALAVVVAFFSMAAPNFLSASNFVIMFKHIAITAILAIGMTYVILTGGIDLSVGSIAGLGGMVAGALILNGVTLQPLGVVVYPSVPLVIVLVLALGGLAGFFNGVLVARFRVAPFIATLGMLYVARGAAMLLSDGATFPNLVGRPDLGNEGFPLLGSATVLGLPVTVLLLAVLALVAAFVARDTPFGRRVYAVGGNERAALLSGCASIG
jgi:erythritol transport system permease protein